MGVDHRADVEGGALHDAGQAQLPQQLRDIVADQVRAEQLARGRVHHHLREPLARTRRERPRAGEEREAADLHLAAVRRGLLLGEPHARHLRVGVHRSRNKHLKELFNRLTDEIIDELSTSKIAELQKEINTLIGKLKKFTEELYDQFEQALDGSYELSIAYQYRHTKEDEALLEVEINLDAKALDAEASTNAAGVQLPSGAALAKQAVRGDFTEVLKFASPDRVLIRKGILTHKVTRAKELSINLFGWRASTTNQLITETEEFFEQKDNGVLHLYNTKVTSISKRKRRGESGRKR